MSEVIVLFVSESSPSTCAVRLTGASASTICDVNRKAPDTGPTFALMPPSNVRSSIFTRSCTPGMQSAN